VLIESASPVEAPAVRVAVRVGAYVRERMNYARPI
jgi:hypothetical protein